MFLPLIRGATGGRWFRVDLFRAMVFSSLAVDEKKGLSVIGHKNRFITNSGFIYSAGAAMVADHRGFKFIRHF